MKVKLGILKEHMLFLLIEGRVDDAREKFPDMEDENFDFLVSNQPTGSNNKYLMWSCKQAEELLSRDPDRQALSLIMQAVRLFDGNQQRLKKRDINQYETVGEVEKAVQELGKSKGEKIREVRADADTVYQDDRFIVVRPHTTEASCKYGTGTKWCIAATGSQNYYNSYSTNNNKFYFVIDRTLPASDPASKFAIAIMGQGEPQVYNAPDRLVSLSTVSAHVGKAWPAMWSKIQAHVKANPVTREVEEAQKQTEILIKTLLSGQDISEVGVKKIAAKGKLTTAVVKALVEKANSNPDKAGDNLRHDIISNLSSRASELSAESAMFLLKWIPSVADKMPMYTAASYYINNIVSKAPLTAESFDELANAADEHTILAIAKNPATSNETMQKIANKVDEFTNKYNAEVLFWELIKKGTITTDQFVKAFRLGNHVKYNLTQHPEQARLSPEMIRMIPITNAYDLKSVMKIPNVPPTYVADAFDKVWKKLTPYELYDLAKTLPFAPEKIEQLWKEKGQDVRTALLQNPAIGPDVAAKFSKSKNSAYRFAVAHNAETPVDALDLLATDASVSTRGAVAANPKVSTQTLAKLAKDEAIAVRANVAINKSASQNVLASLVKDSDAFVRKMARKTLKALTPTETFVRSTNEPLLTETIEDDDEQNIMVPSWREVPLGYITVPDFVAMFLLQNNGHATREEIESAYKSRYPQESTTRYVGSMWGRGRSRRREVTVQAKSLWSILNSEDKTSRWQNDHNPKRAVSAGGRGWWWATPGVNAGAIYRLTPAGASAAMAMISKLQGVREWGPEQAAAPIRKSAPASDAASGPETPRSATAPKTTYKIYGKFKGHPAATRLKGKAYVAPRDTQFSAGEQAYITPDGDKLKVKKAMGDHTQTWDPIDG